MAYDKSVSRELWAQIDFVAFLNEKRTGAGDRVVAIIDRFLTIEPASLLLQVQYIEAKIITRSHGIDSILHLHCVHHHGAPCGQVVTFWANPYPASIRDVCVQVTIHFLEVVSPNRGVFQPRVDAVNEYYAPLPTSRRTLREAGGFQRPSVARSAR